MGGGYNFLGGGGAIMGKTPKFISERKQLRSLKKKKEVTESSRTKLQKRSSNKCMLVSMC